jgi:iron complex outermembrane receptor protein
LSVVRLALSSSVAAAALFACGLAHAQDARIDQVEDVVVTGSQVDLPPPAAGGQVAKGARVGLFGALDNMDAPFAVTGYTEALARNQQARSVADVLQNDPVVRISKGFGNFQELYVVRGFPIYSDDMTYNGVYGVLPRQFVAAEFLERVEVLHGASAFLNGAAPGGSGVGGAVNLMPKRAASGELNRLTAGLEGGGELYLAADVSRRFADDQWGVRANVARRDGESSVEGQERQLTVLGLGVDRRGERARFSADLGWQDHRIDAPRPSVTPLGAVPAAPSGDANFAQPWTYTDERQLFGVARGEFDLAPTVTAWAAVGARDGREENVLANPSATAAGALSAYRFDNAREDRVWAADVGVRGEATTGSVGHRLVASASAVRSASRNAYAFSNFVGFSAGTLTSPVAAARPAANFFIGGDLDDPNVTERVENVSVAVADMLSFLDGRLLATAGVRWQKIETKSYDYNTGAFGSGYTGEATTPAFGLVFKATPQVSLYANYAEALQPGQTAPAVSGGVPVTNAGEVLSPFRAKQGEVGIKYDGGRFGGTASLFRTTLPSAYVENNVFAANGEQENRGLEITGFGEIAAGLRVLGGATWIDAELVNTVGGGLDGRGPIGVPEFQANLNLEWDVPALQGLTVEGRVVHTGEQPANALNTVALDAWTRLDLGARYSAAISGRDVTFRARVENVADEDYWAATGGYPGANYLTLGAPRTLLVSVSADF